MQRLAAALLASTLAYAPAHAESILTTRADSAKAAQGTSGCGIYAFSGVNGFGCFDGAGQTPGLVPLSPRQMPVFSSQSLNKIFFAAPYITDSVCFQDQSAVIQNVLDAAGPYSYVVLPPGCMNLSSGLVTQQSQVVDGAGGFSQTHFHYTAASGVAFTLIGDGSALKNMYLENTFANSSTAAIGVQIGDGTTNPALDVIDTVQFLGFKKQIDVQSGNGYWFNRLYMHNPALYAIHLRNPPAIDNGGGAILRSVIACDSGQTGSEGIRYDSGGGLRVSATTIEGCDRGFDLQVINGANTSDLTLDANVSIENQNIEGVRLGAAPSVNGAALGSFGNIMMNAQISGNGSMPQAVHVSTGVSQVKIGGIQSGVKTGILIDGGDQIVVEPSDVMHIVSTGVSITDPATNVTAGNFSCVGCTIKFADARAFNTEASDLKDSRTISVPANSTAYFYEAAITNLQGIKIDAHLQGFVAGTAVANSFSSTLASNNNNSIATTPIASVNSPGQVRIVYDTISLAGSIRIGISNRSGMVLGGTLDVRVEGKTSCFKRL